MSLANLKFYLGVFGMLLSLILLLAQLITMRKQKGFSPYDEELMQKETRKKTEKAPDLTKGTERLPLEQENLPRPPGFGDAETCSIEALREQETSGLPKA